jgi:hypothetical protein
MRVETVSKQHGVAAAADEQRLPLVAAAKLCWRSRLLANS